jgi:hypothetical protein
MYIHIGPFSINCAGLGKIQFDWKQISIKYIKRKKKIDENNGKEKVPRKSEKMTKYLPNLHYIMPNLSHSHINKLTLSIMCVKGIIAEKNFD